MSKAWMVLAWLIGFFVMALGVHFVYWELSSGAFVWLNMVLLIVLVSVVGVAVLVFVPFFLGAVILDHFLPRFGGEENGNEDD